MKVVLSIAGSDSSGGAGIQADLKTMTANGVFGMTAITALTAQNTTGVTAVKETSPEFLEQQIDACLSDIPVDAVKIGMLPSPELVRVVERKLKQYKVSNIVLDPVMVATSGSKLMKDSTVTVMADLLFKMSTVITPNIPEAEVISQIEINNREDMEKAANKISEDYECSVLIKGGHNVSDACDVLSEGGIITWFEGIRIDNPNTHGTGCTLSSAIASNLALGYDLNEAVARAKNYITLAISDGLNLGKGSGPLNHMAGIISGKEEADDSNKWSGVCSRREKISGCTYGVGI